MSTRPADSCFWEKPETETEEWLTSCNNSFNLLELPCDAGFNFCPFCGGDLSFADPEDLDEDGDDE